MEKTDMTKEEWIEKKKEEKDAVFMHLEAVTDKVRSDPEEFRSYLDAQARLARYSVSNVLLINDQCKGATQLKDFSEWEQERAVIKKGEKSISILEPVEYVKEDGTSGLAYNVKKVFDISQTYRGKQLIPAQGRDPKEIITHLINTSPVECKLTESLLPKGPSVYYDDHEGCIFVVKGTGDSRKVCCDLAREIGHAYLALSSKDYARKEAGFKAETIGYMICSRYGIEYDDLPDIPEGYMNMTTKEFRGELSVMREASSETISKVSAEIYKTRQEKDKGRER